MMKGRLVCHDILGYSIFQILYGFGGYLVGAGIVNSWGYAAGQRIEGGNVLKDVWFWSGKKRKSSKGYRVVVGIVNICWNVVEQRKKAGNAIMDVGSLMRNA